MEFEYTPDGHRAVKIVIPKNNAMRTYTYYVRDAQGNIMATYSRNFQKTIDYANLTYAQVNNSLIAKTSVESFAWFMANAHSAGAPGFVAALKADILASSTNTDWFLNHSSFNPELVLNAESDLGNRVWFNYDRLELFNMVKNTSILTLDHLCNCMKNRKLENNAPNYKSFIEHILSKPKLREAYMAYIYENQNTLYVDFYNKMGVDMVDFPTDLANLISEISSKGISTIGGHWLSANYYEDCASHFTNFQDYLYTNWHEDMGVELSQIEDFNEIFQNTNEDNFDFGCEEFGLSYLFSLLNSQNTATLRNTMIAQVQGTGISTEQQKKNWLINWYFANDPMGSIYLATLRNPALVSNYQTSPGLLYGSNFTQSMENYFIKIKTHFGQSMFDQLVTEFAQQSNLYVDEIKVDEWHLYGSSRLGVYEANKLISKRIARDLNLDNQITTNEYVIETPEEVTYLFSSYQLERGAKRYELANHLGNVLTVISDKKTAICTGNTFNYFAAERISATDYSPFGAPLAGRTWNGGEYRFGFNSMEKDNEINGTGNAYDFGARIYDGRLGRWMSVDALFDKYPHLSPYNFVSNSPIIFLDPDGKVIKPANLMGDDAIKEMLTRFGGSPKFQDVFKLKGNSLLGYSTNLLDKNAEKLDFKDFRKHALENGVIKEDVKKAYQVYLALESKETIDVEVLTTTTNSSTTQSGQQGSQVVEKIANITDPHTKNSDIPSQHSAIINGESSGGDAVFLPNDNNRNNSIGPKAKGLVMINATGLSIGSVGRILLDSIIQLNNNSDSNGNR